MGKARMELMQLLTQEQQDGCRVDGQEMEAVDGAAQCDGKAGEGTTFEWAPRLGASH
jgi:hypothetical protein